MNFNYYVCDKTSSDNRIFDLTEIEFEELKNLHKTFTKFSNIVDCYYNFMISCQDLIELIDYINSPKTNKEDNDEIAKIYPHIKHRFVSNVIFGRVLFDNYQNFCKQLKNSKLDAIRKEYKNNESFKMMKLLRDYSIHYSLSISGLTRNISFTKGVDKLSIYVKKSDLEKNRGANQVNDKFLETVNDDNIYLIDEFYRWRDIFGKFYSEVLAAYIETITEKQQRLLYSKFKYRKGLPNFVDSKLFIPDSIKKTLPKNDKPIELSGREYILSETIEFYTFDTTALNETINFLKEKLKKHNNKF